jgi:hypothetical protein
MIWACDARIWFALLRIWNLPCSVAPESRKVPCALHIHETLGRFLPSLSTTATV